MGILNFGGLGVRGTYGVGRCASGEPNDDYTIYVSNYAPQFDPRLECWGGFGVGGGSKMVPIEMSIPYS